MDEYWKIAWLELTRDICEHQAQIEKLAQQRMEVTRKLYALPGATYRSLGQQLGVSAPRISQILHRDEPKPGRKISGIDKTS